MLTVHIKPIETWDEKTQEFGSFGEAFFVLEHSLVSLSKWESYYMVPFLSSASKTAEQLAHYVHMMVLTPGISWETLSRLDAENIDKIQKYIDSTQSATTFKDLPRPRGQAEIITSELVYYWMTAFQIPWEAQYWHLNRLFALIRICNIKQSKSKKMPMHETAQMQRELNAKRKAEMGTSG